MPYNSGHLPYHPVDKAPHTIEVSGTVAEGETAPRRSAKCKDGLIVRPSGDIHTLWDFVLHGARENPDRQAIGWRSLIKMHQEKKKVPKVVNGVKTEVEKEWQFFELSPYSWFTYKEWEGYTRQLGSGLRKLGFSKGDMMHIFAATG